MREGEEMNDLLAPIADLMSTAGARILEIAAQGLNAQAKPDQSPVTAADEAAEAILSEGLARLLPGVSVVAEEAASRGECASRGSNYFLVDPIDGTRELVAGRTEYTVNVALVRDHRPVLGLIYAPAEQTLYACAAGRALRAMVVPGARFDAGTASPIHVRARAGKLVALVSRSHYDPVSDAYLARLPVERKIPLGSSLKFARVAEGNADVYARLATVSEWDVAAGHALLVAAGGDVTTPDGGALTYGNRPNGFQVDGFIAWGGAPANPDR